MISISHVVIGMVAVVLHVDPLGSAVIVSAYCEARPGGCSDEVRAALLEYAAGQRNRVRFVGHAQTALNFATGVLLLSCLLQLRHSAGEIN